MPAHKTGVVDAPVQDQRQIFSGVQPILIQEASSALSSHVRTRLITAVDENVCWLPVRPRKCKQKAIAVALAIHTDLDTRGRRLHQSLRLMVHAPVRATRGLMRTLPFSLDSGLAGALCSLPARMCGFSFCLGCSLGLAPGPGCL